MKRARMGRYSLWQAADFATHRGVALVIVGALLLLQVTLQLRAFTGGSGVPRGVPPELLLRIGWGIFWSFALIAVLMTVNGIVSGDRRTGYFRFLFSKPLSITAYYASAFAVGLVGVLLGAALMYLGVWWVGIRLPLQVLSAVVLLYALLGSIGFFFSTLMSREWLAVSASLVATAYLRYRADQAGGVLASVARYLLPPIHLGDGVRDATLAGGMPSTTMILWPLVYGLVVFAAALLVLRRRELT